MRIRDGFIYGLRERRGLLDHDPINEKMAEI